MCAVGCQWISCITDYSKEKADFRVAYSLSSVPFLSNIKKHLRRSKINLLRYFTVFQRHVFPLIPQVTDILDFQQKLRFWKIIFKISYLREHLIWGLAQPADFNSMPEPASGDVASPSHARVAVLRLRPCALFRHPIHPLQEKKKFHSSSCSVATN